MKEQADPPSDAAIPQQRAMTPMDEAMRPALKALEAQNKQAEEERNSPAALAEREPFVCLGIDKKEFVYYSRLQEGLIRLKPGEHTKLNLLTLASPTWWEETIGTNWRVDEAAYYCFQAQGKIRYSADNTRGIGMWEENGMPVYNAGDTCFTVKNGKIVETDNVRSNGIIYTRSEPMPHPAANILPDNAGKALIDYLSAYDWREEISPLLLSGYIAQGLLTGYNNPRVHIWINAPAGTGKSRMIARLKDVLGTLCLSFTGGTSEAGIRQGVGNGSRPVILDEMEAANGDKYGRQKLENIMTLIRRSTDGEKSIMGGQDGSPVQYTARSAFALFSIGNTLMREADRSRFLNLHISPNEGEDIFRKRDAAAEELKNITTEALITRMMLLAPTVQRNAEKIQQGLSCIKNLQGRRAELLGILLACSYALTHANEIPAADITKYVDMIAASVFSEETESDAERCLRELMETKAGYQLNTIGYYVNLIATLHKKGESSLGAQETLQEIGIDIYKPKDLVLDSLPYLFIRCRHKQLKELLKGSDFADVWGDVLRDLPFAEYLRQKRIRGTKHPGIVIPIQEIINRIFI